MEKISNRESYLKSISDRNLKIYLMGELVEDPLSHPIIRPSIEAMAETYELAVNDPGLGSVKSPYTGESINRFLHIAESNEDLYLQNKMQRKLGQLTGTCFQRCVGMDAFNALHSVTFEIDEKYSTKYHKNFINFLTEMHKSNLVIGGAMTDVKGDRSKLPHEQEDEDLYLRIVDRDENGVYVKGAKAHQTGCINSHWMVVMPTLRLTEKDKDYAIVGAIPVDAEGITYIYGRQSCDTRSMEPGEYDVGNKYFAGQEAMVIFDNVFIPNELIFMNGEFDFSSILVERFTTYHRRSYVCKAGVGDVLIGAAATIAEYNGVENASHISDKLVEMNKMNETIYATGIASSLQGSKTKSGNYINDDLLG
jgi:4-hydroxybutyryl-CoA dehydratase/vinylacetyl-CoA-Delta-isomerase